MKKLVMVDCISQFHIRFAVEVDDVSEASDIVNNNTYDDEFQEFSQEHLGIFSVSQREIDTKEYLRLFDEDNSYLNTWTDEQKLQFINKDFKL